MERVPYENEFGSHENEGAAETHLNGFARRLVFDNEEKENS